MSPPTFQEEKLEGRGNSNVGTLSAYLLTDPLKSSSHPESPQLLPKILEGEEILRDPSHALFHQFPNGSPCLSCPSAILRLQQKLNCLMAPSCLKCFKVLLSLKITNILIWFSVSFFFSIPNYLSGLIFQDFPLPHLSEAERASVLLSKCPRA